MQTKRLAIRLTSLGDVILASSALEVIPQFSFAWDWVVSQEYAGLFEGHPRISRVISFDRSKGLKGWVQFCRRLWESQYDEVFDLHQSLRTRGMKFLFYFWSISERRPFPKWKCISKQKFKLYPYYLLKGLWPKQLRPTPWVTRFTELVGGTGAERPNLNYLKLSEPLPLELKSHPQFNRGYLCVMPSSRWAGKNWSVSNYVEVLKKLSCFVVILGSKTDQASLELVSMLKKFNILHFSGVGAWNLRQTACVLGGSLGYLGGDTGLAHLAESVGVPVKMIFGPTTPEMGFGPWRPESQVIGLSLGCRPCGKDGRNCHRIFKRHRCLNQLSSQTVLETLGVD